MVNCNDNDVMTDDNMDYVVADDDNQDYVDIDDYGGGGGGGDHEMDNYDVSLCLFLLHFLLVFPAKAAVLCEMEVLLILQSQSPWKSKLYK